MKKLIAGMLVVGSLMVGGMAFADESLFDKVKAVVDRTQPRAGMFYNQRNAEFVPYTGAKVFSADVKGYTIEATAGYSVDKTALAGFETDLLAGLSTIPGVKLEIPWLKVHAGYHVGYSWDDHGAAYGPSINGSIKF